MENGNILIVDDESSLRKVLSDLLKMRGYGAHAVATGPEAIDSVKADSYDVAIVDLRLGEEQMTGMEVIRSIKNNSPDTECIVLTANPSQQSAIQAVNLGAYSYIEKPFNYEQLLGSIQEAIEKHKETSLLHTVEEKARHTETKRLQMANAIRRCYSSVTQVQRITGDVLEAETLEEAQALAQVMRREAQQAMQLLDDVLAYSKSIESDE